MKTGQELSAVFDRLYGPECTHATWQVSVLEDGELVVTSLAGFNQYGVELPTSLSFPAVKMVFPLAEMQMVMKGNRWQRHPLRLVKAS